MPSTTAAETASRSASGKAISAFLPPSSSVTGLSVSEAAFITARPVGTLPMSATLATSGWLASTWPTSLPPGTRFHTPGGRMPSINSASRSEDSGACSGGLTTVGLPAAGGPGGLDREGGPGGGGRCNFPRHEHEGVIERNDAPDHAEGFAHREIHRVRPHGDRGPLHLGDEAGVEIELRGSRLCVAHHL